MKACNTLVVYSCLGLASCDIIVLGIPFLSHACTSITKRYFQQSINCCQLQPITNKFVKVFFGCGLSRSLA